MGERIRSFVALNIPAAVGAEVGPFIDDLRQKIRGVRWVRTGHLHLTMKFLGDVEEENMPAVAHALAGAAAHVPPITVSIRGTGYFPPRGRPRIVWLDMAQGAEELTALQGEMEGVLEPLGFARERRPFRPHLTIGRVRELRERALLMSLLEEAKERRWGTFCAETIHLMRSELFPTGPRYSILREVRLRT